MLNITELILTVSNTTDCKEKTRFTDFLDNFMSKNRIPESDRDKLISFFDSEIDALPSRIEKEEKYKDKDCIFTYSNSLLNVYSKLYDNISCIPKDKGDKIRELVSIINGNRYFENSIDQLFEQEKIDSHDAEHLIGTAAEIKDEYRKGQLYNGILNYKDRTDRFTPEAKEVISAYICAEFNRFLGTKEPDGDFTDAIEIAVDICRYFFGDGIKDALYRILQLNRANITYYAIDTLLEHGCSIPPSAVAETAKCLTYSEMLLFSLQKYGKENLYPTEFNNPEYLAKSDLVHWLTYPTELGAEPDEIVYIGRIRYLFKKEEYYVFRFRSDSDNLDEENKGKWLIGWSGTEGGTFSNFDLYDDYEKGTVEKTLQNIKKKLIG